MLTSTWYLMEWFTFSVAQLQNKQKQPSQKCLVLQFAAMRQVKLENKNFTSAPAVMVFFEEQSILQVLHSPQTWGHNKMSENLSNDLQEKGREDDDWQYIYARIIFWSSVTDKEMRCHKFHRCAEILWLNHCALGLKIYQYKSEKVWFPSVAPVKPEMESLKYQ